MNDYKYISGAVSKFSLLFAKASIGRPLLNGFEEKFRKAYKEDNSWVEQAYAIFMNNLQVTETGVQNYDDAERRAAQYVRNYLDPTYNVEPDLKEWEYELYPVNKECMVLPQPFGKLIYAEELNGRVLKTDKGDTVKFSGEYFIDCSEGFHLLYCFVDFNDEKEIIMYEEGNGIKGWLLVKWRKIDVRDTYCKLSEIEETAYVRIPSKDGLRIGLNEWIHFDNESEDNVKMLNQLEKVRGDISCGRTIGAPLL